MIILDGTLKSIELLLGGAITTNQLQFVTSFVEMDTNNFTPKSLDGVSNDTTAVTIVGAPGASLQRQAKLITVFNADTVASVVTLRLNNNGVFRILVKVSLPVGAILVYSDGEGFRVIDSQGNILQSINLVVGSNLTYTSSVLNTIQDIQTTSEPEFLGLGVGGPNDGDVGGFGATETVRGGNNWSIILRNDNNDPDDQGAFFWGVNIFSIDARDGVGGYFDIFQNSKTYLRGKDISGIYFEVDRSQFTIAGKPEGANGISLVGQGFALIVASDSALGQTGASGSIATFTTVSDGSFEIGGVIDVTAFTAGTVSLQVTYTDPGGTSRTLVLPLVALAGTIGTTVGSATDAQALVTSIRAKGGTTITIATTVAVFTGTYDVFGWIKQID